MSSGKTSYARHPAWHGGFFNNAEDNCSNDRENDHVSFNQINELIEHLNSADFCEIWPEHSLDVVKPKLVGDF